MKKIFSFIVLLAFAAQLFGQNPAKKFILLEHFTNSKCSICASKNPAFYNIINTVANAKNIHHLSIHPSTPYSDCVFYQANTVENQAIANFYNVVGTPVLFLNGASASGSTLITQAKLDAAAALTSPITIIVTETANANGSTDVKVAIKTVDAANTSGNFVLNVALSEKTVNQTTPNGESVHRDVFRDMLTTTAGTSITLPAVGQSTEHTFNYTAQSGWKPSELFVTAYVRNLATKAILQSGTRFDAIVLETSQPIENQSVSLFPNPATDQIFVSSENIIIESIDVFNAAGQRVFAQTEGIGTAKIAVKTGDLALGIYFTKVKTRTGTSFGKFVKQ